MNEKRHGYSITPEDIKGVSLNSPGDTSQLSGTLESLGQPDAIVVGLGFIQPRLDNATETISRAALTLEQKDDLLTVIGKIRNWSTANLSAENNSAVVEIIDHLSAIIEVITNWPEPDLVETMTKNLRGAAKNSIVDKDFLKFVEEFCEHAEKLSRPVFSGSVPDEPVLDGPG